MICLLEKAEQSLLFSVWTNIAGPKPVRPKVSSEMIQSNGPRASIPQVGHRQSECDCGSSRGRCELPWKRAGSGLFMWEHTWRLQGCSQYQCIFNWRTHRRLLNYNPKQLCQLCIYSSILACYRPVLWRRCYESKTRLEQGHPWGKAPVMVGGELDQRALVSENGF